METENDSFHPTSAPLTPESLSYKPPRFTPDELADGSAAIRWVTAEGVAGRPTLHDLLAYAERRGAEIRCPCLECKARIFALASQTDSPLSGAQRPNKKEV